MNDLISENVTDLYKIEALLKNLECIRESYEEHLQIANELKLQCRLELLKWLEVNPGLLRDIRGESPQKLIAIRADIPQPYISKLETGDIHQLHDGVIIRALHEYSKLEQKNAD
jgi:hypothetical protein